MFKLVNKERFMCLNKLYRAIFFKGKGQLVLCEKQNDDLKDVRQILEFCKTMNDTMPGDQTLYFLNDLNDVGVEVVISNEYSLISFLGSLRKDDDVSSAEFAEPIVED